MLNTKCGGGEQSLLYLGRSKETLLAGYMGSCLYLNKGKAGNFISSLPHISPIKSHFSGISHAQTPAMATRINLLLFDQVSRSREYPLLKNIQIFKILRSPLTTNFDTAGQPFTYLLSPYRGSSERLTCGVNLGCVRLTVFRNWNIHGYGV